MDLAKSKGNYVVDVDGGASLDACTGDINPLGYNHESLRALAIGKSAKTLDAGLINMADAGSVASVGFHSDATRVLNKIRPDGMNGLTLVSSRSAV
jgi:4-aminobutyrate aminotransferase-like enzyme